MTGRVTFTEDARRDLDELAQQDRRLAVQALRTAARLGRGEIRGKALGDFVKTGDLRDCHSLYFGATEEEDTHRLVYRETTAGREVVEVVAVGEREADVVYLLTGLRLGRLRHPVRRADAQRTVARVRKRRRDTRS